MATCLNCKKNLSCGCQKKVASDKKSVCTNCIGAYETRLVKQKVAVASKPSVLSNKSNL